MQLYTNDFLLIPTGKKLFSESLSQGYMECYFKLAEQFRTQDEPAFCGLTTLVMVLNSLSVDPGRVWKGPWRWYHENMLDCCVPLQVVEKYQNGNLLILPLLHLERPKLLRVLPF